MKQLRDYVSLFLIAGTLIGLDQWTKAIVRANLSIGETWLPESLNWLAPYARIIHWHNSGAAFGMFQDYGWVFTVLAFAVVGLIIYYYPRVDSADWWMKLAMSMQMGGAIGNLIDRLAMGKVTDFISIGTFPVFNVADSSISVGVAVLLLGAWFKEMGERKLAQGGADAAGPGLSIESVNGQEGRAGE